MDAFLLKLSQQRALAIILPIAVFVIWLRYQKPRVTATGGGSAPASSETLPSSGVSTNSAEKEGVAFLSRPLPMSDPEPSQIVLPAVPENISGQFRSLSDLELPKMRNMEFLADPLPISDPEPSEIVLPAVPEVINA